MIGMGMPISHNRPPLNMTVLLKVSLANVLAARRVAPRAPPAAAPLLAAALPAPAAGEQGKPARQRGQEGARDGGHARRAQGAESGRQLWSDEYAFSLDRLLDIQRGMAEQIAAIIERERGPWHFRGFTVPGMAEAMFRRALDADPGFARAPGARARVRLQARCSGRLPAVPHRSRPRCRRRGREVLEKAWSYRRCARLRRQSSSLSSAAKPIQPR
jgi:hypothetical protein